MGRLVGSSTFLMSHVNVYSKRRTTTTRNTERAGLSAARRPVRRDVLTICETAVKGQTAADGAARGKQSSATEGLFAPRVCSARRARGGGPPDGADLRRRGSRQELDIGVIDAAVGGEMRGGGALCSPSTARNKRSFTSQLAAFRLSDPLVQRDMLVPTTYIGNPDTYKYRTPLPALPNCLESSIEFDYNYCNRPLFKVFIHSKSEVWINAP
ncbi:hypothetical protein EVAR_2522_1 [Eumeta japonica]|uniref:Uncharacterized protein n=1 Tax=Eumeta variegata TaxID=151549 RepID=A0A4C1SPC6_EUMVA|nr:hypothetical protein EVAR_2522_1 [Eumeta japonica]